MKNQVTRPPYLGKLIIAFILGTLIFCSVFLLGYTISYYKMQSTALVQEDLRYQLLSMNIEQELLGNSCKDFDPSRFSNERNRVGAIIGLLEERLGKENAQVLEQKKIYSILEGNHFLYIKQHNENCNNTVPFLLFFYSNKGPYKDEAQKLGYIITTLNNEKPELMVYSFDYDLDSSIIELLKEKYNITIPNQLVINGKTIQKTPQNIDEIREILG